MTATIPPFLASLVDRFDRKRFFDHPRRAGKPFWYSLHSRDGASLNLQSNDYLGLCGHPFIVDTAIMALMESGHEAVMSQAFAVTQLDQCEQRRFERRLGEFIGQGSGILCQSGYDANVGLLQAIAPRGLPVYVDQYAHASLYQGIHAAEAVPVRVRHNDMNDLRTKLISGGPGVVVVDSVYSPATSSSSRERRWPGKRAS